MFIYADESGHSGRHIFNEPTYYFQGAILAESDPESLLCPLADQYRQELSIERLHANALKPYFVERIASSFLILLEKINWQFHLTVIEKPYLAIIKFVDSIFDSFENQGVRWQWYNHEFFRHTLCCLFDEMLSARKKKEFWEAYLRDDYDELVSIVQWTLNILDTFEIDERLEEVVRDGLAFALKYPRELTLTASETRKSYKGHTPNMVAFASLIDAIHQFCEEKGVVPELFVHDPQSEFGPTMKEYHDLFSKFRMTRSHDGFRGKLEEINYGLGNFALTPSKQLTSLQAVDLFLWLSQRIDRIKSPGLRKALEDKIDPFYISRVSSEMIVDAWHYKLSYAEFTEEQIKEGELIVEKIETVHKKQLNEFESKNQLSK